jgi:hypothetical protein
VSVSSQHWHSAWHEHGITCRCHTAERIPRRWGYFILLEAKRCDAMRSCRKFKKFTLWHVECRAPHHSSQLESVHRTEHYTIERERRYLWPDLRPWLINFKVIWAL